MLCQFRNVRAYSTISKLTVARYLVLMVFSLLHAYRRPGVLVLINDCDWELCGGLDAELEEKDVVVFISTLHGG
jgi:hypothetical protein